MQHTSCVVATTPPAGTTDPGTTPPSGTTDPGTTPGTTPPAVTTDPGNTSPGWENKWLCRKSVLINFSKSCHPNRYRLVALFPTNFCYMIHLTTKNRFFLPQQLFKQEWNPPNQTISLWFNCNMTLLDHWLFQSRAVYLNAAGSERDSCICCWHDRLYAESNPHSPGCNCQFGKQWITHSKMDPDRLQSKRLFQWFIWRPGGDRHSRSRTAENWCHVSSHRRRWTRGSFVRWVIPGDQFEGGVKLKILWILFLSPFSSNPAYSWRDAW